MSMQNLRVLSVEAWNVIHRIEWNEVKKIAVKQIIKIGKTCVRLSVTTDLIRPTVDTFKMNSILSLLHKLAIQVRADIKINYAPNIVLKVERMTQRIINCRRKKWFVLLFIPDVVVRERPLRKTKIIVN